ncbi:MAG: membrane protein [Clostridiaceae bacterium BRH_c20a]|nr:MAG: membrane protein [Clostridiaceae bacterium BRH_c20a]
MVQTLFYPTFLLIVFILSLILIPKKDYKEYFIYGVILGGFGDVLVVGLFQNILNIIWFKNAGIFNALGQNLLSPPCWIFVVMLFLRFLPSRRAFLYLYIITVAFSSVGYGILVHNAGLFDYKPWFYPVFSFFTFLGWWCFITWVFLKTSTFKNEKTTKRLKRG